MQEKNQEVQNGEGVVLNIKISDGWGPFDVKEQLDKILGETWELKKEHPNIKVNIEVRR